MTDRATTYDELKDAISARLSRAVASSCSASRASRSSKPHDLALGTVAAVAEATEVQPSAMIRFANALGYRRLLATCSRCSASHLVERGAPLPRAHRPAAPQAAAGARAPGGVLHQLRRRVGRRAAPARGARRPGAPATRRCELHRRRAAHPRAGAAPRLSGRLLPRLRARPARAARPPARRRRRHAARAAARHRRAATCCWSASFRNYSPDVVEIAAGVPRARRRR